MSSRSPSRTERIFSVTGRHTSACFQIGRMRLETQRQLYEDEEDSIHYLPVSSNRNSLERRGSNVCKPLVASQNETAGCSGEHWLCSLKINCFLMSIKWIGLCI